MDWSPTPPLHRCHVTISLAVAPLHTWSSNRPQHESLRRALHHGLQDTFIRGAVGTTRR